MLLSWTSRCPFCDGCCLCASSSGGQKVHKRSLCQGWGSAQWVLVLSGFIGRLYTHCHCLPPVRVEILPQPYFTLSYRLNYQQTAKQLSPTLLGCLGVSSLTFQLLAFSCQNNLHVVEGHGGRLKEDGSNQTMRKLKHCQQWEHKIKEVPCT